MSGDHGVSVRKTPTFLKKLRNLKVKKMIYKFILKLFSLYNIALGQ